MLVPLILVWDRTYIRIVTVAWLIVVAAGLPYLLWWFMPRTLATFRLPVEEYIRRRVVLRQVPRRPKWKVLVSVVLGSGGLGLPPASFVVLLLGPYTSGFALHAVYPLLGIGLVLWAAFLAWIVPLYRRMDGILLGSSFESRLWGSALSLASGGVVMLLISVLW